MAQYGQSVGLASRPEGELRATATALAGTIESILRKLDDLDERLYQSQPKAVAGSAAEPNQPTPGLSSIEIALHRAHDGLDRINGRLGTLLERL